ncbi:MAG: hypothetical protein LBQ22_01520 [Bacteroidales bacterium]|jgi:hypothetical protein|nr:hypothetical protein [Bacteroidales bacterium]
MNDFMLPVDNFNLKNREHIYLLQQALLALGYPIDPNEIWVYEKTTKAAVLSFQEDNDIKMNDRNVSSETLIRINSALENVYKIYGYIRNDIGVAIPDINITVTLVIPSFEEIIGSARSLSDGKYCCYLNIPKEFISEKGGMKMSMPVIMSFYDVTDKEVYKTDIFSFDSISKELSFNYESFINYRQSLSDYIIESLSIMNIQDGELWEMMPDDIIKLSLQLSIDFNMLIKMTLANELQKQSGFDRAIIFGIICQNVPQNIPFKLLLQTKDQEEWDLHKKMIFEKIDYGMLFVSIETLTNAIVNSYKYNYTNYKLIQKEYGEVEKLASAIFNYIRKTGIRKNILDGDSSLYDIITAVSEKATDPLLNDILDIFLKNSDNLDKFIEEFNSEKYYTLYGTETVNIISAGFNISRIAWNFPPMVKLMYNNFDKDLLNTNTKILGTLNLKLISEFVKATGYPKSIPGSSEEEKATNYINLIYADIQIMYPDINAVTLIIDDPDLKFDYDKEILNILLSNPDFNILKDRIDKLNIDNPEITGQLKKFQNVARISPTPDDTLNLLKCDITNAAQVYYTGKQQLKNIFETKLLRKSYSEEQINGIYNLSTGRYALNLFAFSDIHNSFHQATPVSISPYERHKLADEFKDEIPDIEILFGDETMCECPYDSSVYSAAAYLADLLAFLKGRRTSSNNTMAVVEYLVQKRPDIELIYLNEQNTNTLLPYIDLICEVLEEAVLKTEYNFNRSVSQCQTTLSSKELLAAPEHLLQYGDITAYDMIKENLFPMYAPLNLWQTETRTFLKEIGINRYELIDYFIFINTTLGPPESRFAAEYFELTSFEESVVTGNYGTVISRNSVWSRLQDFSGDIKRMLVTDFMKDTNLNVYQVLDIANSKWPGIKTNFTTDCSYKNEYIEGTAIRFDKTHRFIRLWQKTGWKIWELDLLMSGNYLMDSPEPDLSILTLSDIGFFNINQKKLNLSVEDAVVLYGNISTDDYFENGRRQQSIYDKIFLNTTLRNPVNEKLENIKNGNNYASFDDFSEEDKSIIAACVSLTLDELLYLNSVWDQGEYGIEFLSYLYRYSILSKKTKFSVYETFLWVSMINDDDDESPCLPFNMNYRNMFDIPSIIKESSFTLTDIEYLVRYGKDGDENEISENAKLLALTNEQLIDHTEKILTILEAGKLAIPSEDQIIKKTENPENPEDPENTGTYITNEEYKNYFINYLLTVERFSNEELIFQILDLIEAEINITDDKISVFIDEIFPEMVGITLEGKEILMDLDPITTSSYLEERYTYIINYINQTNVYLSLIESIAESFDVSTPIIEQYLLHKFRTGEGIKNLIEKIIEAYIPENEETETKLHDILKLINKACLVIKKLDLTLEEYTLLFKMDDTASFGLFYFNYENIETDLYTILRLIKIVEYQKTFGTANNGLNLFKILDQASDYDQFVELFSNLTGYSVEEINLIIKGDLDLHFPITIFHLSFVPYGNSVYDSVLKLSRISKQYNVSISQLYKWTKRDNNNEKAISQEVKDKFKSLYDINTWLDKMPEIQNPIREAKSFALAEFLIIKYSRDSGQWYDRTDLYSNFLLDTEMSSCMKISRIVQATNSVQLFVQRAKLNMEQPVVIDEEYDEQWKQWEWMKKYRLWEANRKIFLYPENWIEPELRDNKTSFFKELEDELSQNEINEQNVEIAVDNYLKKLSDISRLTIIGYNTNTVFFDDKHHLDTDPTKDKIIEYHIVGRTNSKPYQYYYRKLDIFTNIWTNWLKIDLEIETDNIVPVVFNNKLHLFWLNVINKNINTSKNNEPGDPIEYAEVQLCWTIYKNNKWSEINYSYKKHIEFRDVYNTYPMPKKSDYFLSVHGGDSESLVFFVNMSRNEDTMTTPFRYGVFYFNGDVYRAISMSNHIIYNGISADYPLPSAAHYLYEITYIEKIKNILSQMNEDEIPEIYLYSMWGNVKFNVSIISSRFYMKPANAISERTGVYDPGISKNGNNITKDNMLTTNKKDPNFFILVNNRRYYEAFPESLYAFPSFYQDSARTFFINPVIESSKRKYLFFPHYHPYTKLFREELYKNGIDGIFNRSIQTPSSEQYDFYKEYDPDSRIGKIRSTPEYVKEIVDFNSSGSYSAYNWELFFHIPFYIANKLSQEQKFEEAMKWYNYIFNPTTTTSGSSPQKFWVTKPLYEINDITYQSQHIARILSNISLHVNEINEWLNNPYNPHLIARSRLVAYQKAIVMKYIDNIIAWADQLFRQDTLESNNEATLLYILAYEILGKRPALIPKDYENISYINFQDIEDAHYDLLDGYGRIATNSDQNAQYIRSIVPDSNSGNNIYTSVNNYQFLESLSNQERSNRINTDIDAGSPVVIETIGNSATYLIENKTETVPSKIPTYNEHPDSHFFNYEVSITEGLADRNWNERAQLPTYPLHNTMNLPRIDAKNFCIPHNEQLWGYWDIVEDRLFKLRNCMNIEGIVRELPLFEPPIDPAMLVKAVAAGLSIGDALNEITAPQPYYRFRIILQKAIEFTSEVKQLGDKLLSALEKKDAETLGLLNSIQQINLLQSSLQVRKLQVDEASENIEAINQSILMTEARKEYYSSRESVNSLESKSFDLSIAAGTMDIAISSGKILAAGLSYIPDFQTGGAGATGSPVTVFSIGGTQISSSLSLTMDGLSVIGRTLDRASSLSATKAGYQRRKEDWDFQAAQANIEIEQLKTQLVAAEIRLMVAEKELQSFELQIEQGKSILDYYKSKYTNEDLYNWMVTKISSVFFQSYKLAYDMAKKAENCYCHELGIYETPNFIQFGYWDSLRRGLLSGEQLLAGLHQLDAAYINANKRTLELTKHISLAEIYPGELIKLKTSSDNSIEIELPEMLFNMDYPGHYMRRIKSVSITIPNVAGPFTNISCMLTLQKSKVRVKSTLVNGTIYTEETPTDNRFVYQTGGREYICTSNAQNDSGMFELNFSDERYLPFENAGVISSWQIRFPSGISQINLDSISDVILHINYTALHDGRLENEAIKELRDNLPEMGAVLFSPKVDFPDEWYKMSSSLNETKFTITEKNLPFFMRMQQPNIYKISVNLSSLNDLEVGGNTPKLIFKKNENSIEIELTKYVRKIKDNNDTINGEANGNIYLYAGEYEPASGNIATLGEWKLEFSGFSPKNVENIVAGFILKNN